MSTGLVTHRACRSGPRSTPALLAAMHRPAASLGSGPTRESKDGSGRLLLGVSHAFERCIGLSTTHQRRPRSSCARSRRARRPFQRSALSACSPQTSDAACFHRSNGLTGGTHSKVNVVPQVALQPDRGGYPGDAASNDRDPNLAPSRRHRRLLAKLKLDSVSQHITSTRAGSLYAPLASPSPSTRESHAMILGRDGEISHQHPQLRLCPLASASYRDMSSPARIITPTIGDCADTMH